MPAEVIEVLVVGGGQAGLAMSEHLSGCGVPHLVLERDRIAERWRSGRWDSLVANGPAWHDRFPGMEFDVDPDAFASKEQVADYFVAYAEQDRGADPLRRRGDVRAKERRPPGLPGRDLGRHHRRAPTWWRRPGRSSGRSSRRSSPTTPGPCRSTPAPTAIPASCPTARSSWSGRDRRGCRSRTSCCVRAGGSTSRSARTTGRRAAIAGATSCWWLGVLGKWDAEAPPAGAEHVTIAVSGADGGAHGRLPRPRRARHASWSGRTTSFDDGVMRFAPDLRPEHRERRRELPVAARRGRRLRRAQRPRPAGGAGGPRPRAAARTA